MSTQSIRAPSAVRAEGARPVAPAPDARPEEASGPPAAEGVSRGGGTHVVQRGDTLTAIALRTYGNARYWVDLMRANPTQVFRGGDLILVGAELVLPTITVPAPPSSATETPAAPPPEPAAPPPPVVPAVEGRGVCTEFGDFTIYPDDFVGPLPPQVGTSRPVHEAEFRTLRTQWEAEQNARRQQVESEVDDLLSYGAFDWAVTDGDASRAVMLLGGLPMGQLQQAVRNIPTIGRLLENTPANVRSTAAYARVLVALGPSRVGPYLRELLSYGVFDWAVTDAEARAVLDVLALLPPDQLTTVLTDLGRPMQLRFLQNLPARGSALAVNHKAALRAMFDAAADSDLELLELAFEIRFNVDVRGSSGQAWDAAGLRRCWGVLETLPPAQVEANPELLQWIRYGNSASGHGGWYDPGASSPDYRGAGFNYTTANIPTATQSSEFDTDGDGTISASERDPLHGVNRFDKVVRHEVGHAVDEQIGGVGGYCMGKPGGGNWTTYGGNANTAITAMVAAAAGGISAAPAGAQTAIVAALVTGAAANENAATLLARIQALPEYTALSAAEKSAIDGDTLFGALGQAVDDPWYNHLPNGGTPLGGRIYQRSYPSEWTSYDPTTRARKVSQYQFRAPGEWFAEAYAAYYQPNADGTCDHHFLGNIDGAAKTWFDANVDPVVGSR